MITAFQITNNEAVTYAFNQDFNPISDFDITPDMRVDKSRIKPQTHGVWPTPTYRDGMSINVEYELLADDTADYVAKRKTMVAALFGANFTGLVSENQLGTLSITFDGESEAWDADYTIDAFSGPKTWTELAFSHFLITFYCFTPYFTGHTTPANKYRWS